jgi:hypothetical protein
MTPVMHDVTGVIDTGKYVHASPVSLTPVNACFAGVNDTGEEFFPGVVDTGEAL